MQPHGSSVWVCVPEKSGGFSTGAAAPFGARPLEQRCSVLYLTARLAGKQIKVVPDVRWFEIFDCHSAIF